MEFTNFKEDFPFFSSLFLENNSKQDSFTLMGNSINANGFQALDNPPDLNIDPNYISPFPNHPHHYHQDVHGHEHGHDHVNHANDYHHHRHHHHHHHHHEVFPTDLNYEPSHVMPENNDGYHHGHGDHRNHDYDHHHHHDQHDGVGEHMVPLDQILAFHDLNVMPEEEEEEEAVMMAQPVEEAAREPARGPAKTSVVKGQWSPEEDRLLIQLVERYGVKKWSQIAQKLNGRIGKQCRERWHNHLRPDIRKEVWSTEEDMILIQAHMQHGNKWAEIAKFLPGRSENTIKNHWNATMRKQLSKRNRAMAGPSFFARPTLLEDYIRRFIPKSLLELDNDDDKKKKMTTSSKRKRKLSADNEADDADDDDGKRDINLEMPPEEPAGPIRCRRGLRLFDHHQPDPNGPSEEAQRPRGR